jgi:hypothetical protein
MTWNSVEQPLTPPPTSWWNTPPIPEPVSSASWLSSPLLLLVSGLAIPMAYGAPTITPGNVNIRPAGLVIPVAYGAPKLNLGIGPPAGKSLILAYGAGASIVAHHNPTYTQYSTNTNVAWPSWANNCDGIVVGGGGGGGAGGFGTNGGGGGAGNFGAITWTRAQWIAGGSGLITMAIAGGGNRGASTGAAGGPGGTTQMTLQGVSTVSGTGGAGGGGGTNAPQGGGGGTFTYNGQGYTRAGPVGGLASNGVQPGCGGNGGGSFGAGGFGGNGGTWLYFYE